MENLPKDTFNFGEAIALIKKDKTVARVGWNGKNMYLFLHKGKAKAEVKTDENTRINGVDIELFNLGESLVTVIMPSIAMRTADGSIVIGWLASQTDMLAEDWTIATAVIKRTIQ